MITQKTFAKVKVRINLPGIWLGPGAEGWITPHYANEGVTMLFEMDHVAVDISKICKRDEELYFFELEQIPQA